MVKINFEKVERDIGEAQHNWFIKKVASQKSVSYPRAAAFFGHDVAKPGPQDSVIGAITEWRHDLLEEEIAEKKAAIKKDLEIPKLTHTTQTLTPTKEKPVEEDVKTKAVKEPTAEKPALFTLAGRISASQEGADVVVFDEAIARAPAEEKTRLCDSLADGRKLTEKVNKAEKPLFQDVPSPTVSSIYILRKRLLWFARKRVSNIYKLLGTTKEEVIALRKKKTRTAEDDKRVEELLQKSHELNEKLRKKLGFSTDEELIEKEKARHITKRFNIRETWLPL